MEYAKWQSTLSQIIRQMMIGTIILSENIKHQQEQ